MTVHLRADDRQLLDQLARRTGVGITNGPYRTAGSSPSVNWTVVKSDDLERLTAILDRDGQLRGRKREEFALWQAAVAIYRERCRHFESELVRLRNELAGYRARIVES